MDHHIDLPTGVVGIAHPRQSLLGKLRSIGFRIILIVILGNLFVLDLYLFEGRYVASTKEEIPVTSTTPDSTSFETLCTTACEDKLHALVASMTAAVVPSNETVAVSPTVKEIYVPLGVGSNATDDWTDVPGANAYVDTTQYTTIKKVTFEVSLRNPNTSQEVFVRLYNVTDKHPVWFSEMSTTDASELLSSNPVTLDRGNKLYQVQMKTQLRATALLDQSRLRIQTQ